MKKIAIAMIAVVAFAGAAFAADVIEFPAKNGKVTFNHKKHQEALKDCKSCHATEKGGKIEGFGKDIAHKTCKGCHEEKKAGPTKCGECHKK
ncbi:MAG: cytochrome c family protein [Geobacteraceae bacterium]|nr:cytochrome c family protein [Geobacteraceae bacterium]